MGNVAATAPVGELVGYGKDSVVASDEGACPGDRIAGRGGTAVVNGLQFIPDFVQWAGGDGLIVGMYLTCAAHPAVETVETFGCQVVECATENVDGDTVCVIDRAGCSVDGSGGSECVFAA